MLKEYWRKRKEKNTQRNNLLTYAQQGELQKKKETNHFTLKIFNRKFF